MATTVNSVKITASCTWDVENSTTFGEYGTTGTDAPASSANSFTHGTGSGQADQVHIVQGTLAGGASVDIDLSGTLDDAVGNVMVAARVKGVYFRHIASTGNTGTGTVLGDAVANDVVSWAIPVRRGGFVAMCSNDSTGIAAVTAGTGDLFRITNSDGANSVEYFLVLVCASA